MLSKSIIITFGAFLVVSAIVLAARPTYKGTRVGFPDADYLKSQDCRSCHADHSASWARTYHSRMTQEAAAANVQGDFTHNNSFDYLGVPIGFLLGGIWHYESDPGLGIWLVPPAALLLIFGVVAFALAARRHGEGS